VAGTASSAGAAKNVGTDGLQLLPEALPYLESASHALAAGWMVVLVGPRAVGKTSLARLLALLADTPLHELTLTASSDTSDLLGGFEQMDVVRQVRALSHAALVSPRIVNPPLSPRVCHAL
jgi:midasin (ATPase involved in ribosome maturation)